MAISFRSLFAKPAGSGSPAFSPSTNEFIGDFLVAITFGSLVGDFMGRVLAPFFRRSDREIWEQVMAEKRLKSKSSWRDSSPSLQVEIDG